MDTRGQIIEMAKNNLSARQICRELGIPHTTVAYTIRRFNKTGENSDTPRSGRPAILTERDKRHLARTVKQNRFMPLQEITNQLPVEMSIPTARKALNEGGIDHFIAAKKNQDHTKKYSATQGLV